jgi:hypothetical protein
MLLLLLRLLSLHTGGQELLLQLPFLLLLAMSCIWVLLCGRGRGLDVDMTAV